MKLPGIGYGYLMYINLSFPIKIPCRNSLERQIVKIVYFLWFTVSIVLTKHILYTLCIQKVTGHYISFKFQLSNSFFGHIGAEIQAFEIEVTF